MYRPPIWLFRFFFRNKAAFERHAIFSTFVYYKTAIQKMFAF